MRRDTQREKTTFIKRKKINRANLRLLSFAIQTPKLGRRAAPSIFSAQTKHRETRRLVKFHSHDCIAERELRVKLIRTLSRNKGGRGCLIVAQRPNRAVALAEEHSFVLEKPGIIIIHRAASLRVLNRAEQRQSPRALKEKTKTVLRLFQLILTHSLRT